MFKLTREVRFALDTPAAASPGNGYGGIPPVARFGPFLQLRVTLCGDLDGHSSYLRNIVEIDAQVRQLAIPHLRLRWREGASPSRVLPELYAVLTDGWPGATLAAIELDLSPYQTLGLRLSEPEMIRLSQLFEFSAAHRLHNPALSDADNVKTFGKCNNPLGHGHNYQVKVTLTGQPDANGALIPLPELERLVAEHAIDPLDHKHLNLQVAAFADTNPSVENIARVIYGWLKTPLHHDNARLTSVTVWETPKTYCEYSEEVEG